MATTTITTNGNGAAAAAISAKPSISFTDNFVQIIDGKASPTKESRHGLNPATKQPNFMPLCTKDDLDRAVEAGKAAFRTLSKVPYEERRAKVLAYCDAKEKLHTEFRDLLISEQGKPISRFVRSSILCDYVYAKLVKDSPAWSYLT
ncbi:hypothetical protein SBRCBS47491_008791 [Sporothrix bragantina]|uniref:Aldehyde dehydrogenase domain-containing protein n=1 Tax=Sporothrix bragantina TaxID=671064 RepID=A0ABP0CQ74_9PEZI